MTAFISACLIVGLAACLYGFIDLLRYVFGR